MIMVTINKHSNNIGNNNKKRIKVRMKDLQRKFVYLGCHDTPRNIKR